MAGRIVGVVAGMFVGVMVSPAAAQSLGDVARQEAARREQLGKTERVAGGKVLTNADLPASAVVAPPGASPTPDAPAPEGDAATSVKPPGAANAAGGTAETAAKGERAPSDDEPGWRARGERVNAALAKARAQVRQLKALSDRLSLEAQASDPAIVARAQAERTDIRARVLEAEKAEASALADRQALEQEARVAGVPPAWIK